MAGGHHPPEGATESKSPSVGIIWFVAAGLLAAIIAVVFLVNMGSGSRDKGDGVTDPVDQVTGAVANSGGSVPSTTTQRVETVEARATDWTEEDAPPAISGERLIIEAEPGMQHCYWTWDGFIVRFQNRSFQWVDSVPSDGVRAWAVQSATAEPQQYKYRWSSRSDCRLHETS